MKSLLLNIVLQQVHTTELADAQSTQKFYVVVAVIAVLFVGLLGYMISVDRKIKKLEK
jgi:Tfp pilus assembly protein PilO